MNYDKFQTKVWKTGSSLVLTIPDKVAKFAGYQPGEELRVMVIRADDTDKKTIITQE